MRYVVVGPSPCIEGLNLGSIIDSYDVVVRVNNTFQLAQSNPENYGKKTDMVFNTFDKFYSNIIDEMQTIF